jgi:hypothetical protein
MTWCICASACDMVYQFWEPIDQIAICYLADKRYDTGKTGEFNRYWDQEIDPKEEAVRATCPPYTM